MSDVGERNQNATPLRLQQAKAQGDTAKSYELAAAISMLGVIGVGYLTLSQFAGWLQAWTVTTWSVPNTKSMQSADAYVEQMQSALAGVVYALLPFLLAIFLIAIASHWGQTGPKWLPAKASFDVTNLGPQKWWQRLGWENVASTLGLGIPKVMFGIALLVVCLWCQRASLLELANFPADVLVEKMFGIVALVCLQVAAAMVVLGVADYGFQWFGFRRRNRMTNQEIREEQKMQGGDSVNRLRQRQGIS